MTPTIYSLKQLWNFSISFLSYAIFINKYSQEGDERTIMDITNQLKIYFKSTPMEYYYIEKKLKIDISPKSKLTLYKTIWVNY